MTRLATEVRATIAKPRDPFPDSQLPPLPRPVTPSGIEIPAVVSADYLKDKEPEQPGQYPFTRGLHPNGYRSRLWTIRQYGGFGTAEETNERFRFLLEQGQTGLSVAFDLPTQCGFDPIDPMARAEVGRVGVSMATLAEAELLFEGIDLGSISTSFTINGTAAIIYAMYLAVADKRGVPRERLNGTVQNDILKEFAARGTWIFPVKPSMRLVSDVILYSTRHTPKFNPINICGGHFREAGATAVEEVAYMFADAIAYVDDLVRRGGNVAEFAKGLSFLFCVHMEFFEEICKFRASRRIWAKLMHERYGVKDPRAQQFRVFTSGGGVTLTAAQPMNNIVRVAYETLAQVLGGSQCIFTMAYDEAYQLPTELSAEIALRTQHILAYETGVTKTVDPLGGSYFVEWLTDRLEQEIMREMETIEAQGGMVRAIEEGWLQRRLAERALERKAKIDRKETIVVGENAFRRKGQINQVGETFRLDPRSAQRIRERYGKTLKDRDAGRVRQTLERLLQAAQSEDENLVPHLIDCCHAYATVGEMVKCLRGAWGNFEEPVRL